MSKGDSTKAQIIIRNYVMGRFLERLSISAYRDILILKGGILVSSMVGLDNRTTLDVDATVKNHPLSLESARKVVEEIISVQIEDGTVFKIISIDNIMGELEYSGVRVTLDTTIDTMHTPLKVDFSTGDVITPREVEYSFPLLFEERSVSILAYNLETVLAEKIETLISRGTANTRMRDFYDIYILETIRSQYIDLDMLRLAYLNTSKHRGSITVTRDFELILNEIQCSPELMVLWSNYQKRFDYAKDISWIDVMKSVRKLCSIAKDESGLA